MRILFLPENIASVPSITSTYLNKVEGVEAISITPGANKYHHIGDSIRILPNRMSLRKRPFHYLLDKRSYKKELYKWIDWADVLHYTWRPGLRDGSDLKYAKAKNKPILVEWVGSEIRNPDILMSINPYYAHAYYNGYEYANIESAANSTSIQTLFASYGAIPLMGPEISLFIKRDLFKRCYENIHQRLDLTDYQPNYPSILQNKPLIVHSPTARIAKGSAYILKAIERLRAKYDFEFRLIENMSRMEALKWMKKSDIFIDQLIIGSHGMAATEAMALGKPVLCYIMQEVFEAGLPSDCPIINANPDTIESQLVCLLEDAAWRHHQGRASRSYVETYYDAKVVAANLLNIYRREIVITDPS